MVGICVSDGVNKRFEVWIKRKHFNLLDAEDAIAPTNLLM